MAETSDAVIRALVPTFPIRVTGQLDPSPARDAQLVSAGKAQNDLRGTPPLPRPFVGLWLGYTVAQHANYFTLAALPLAAATLQASASQMGLLVAAGLLPFLLIAPIVGVLADRSTRLTIPAIAEFGRATVLIGIPLVAAADGLSMTTLYVIAVGIGVLAVFSEISVPSVVPLLVSRDGLVRANARLELGRSAGQLVGPILAGLLLQTIMPAHTLIAAGALFALSGLVYGSLRSVRLAREAAGRAHWLVELRDGLDFVAHTPALRVLILATAAANLFIYMATSIYVLLLARDFGLSPAVTGLILSAAAPGAVIGSLISARIASRLGLGPTLVISLAVHALTVLMIPVAALLGPLAAVMLLVARVLWGASLPLYNASQITVRQLVTPATLLGRVSATFRWAVWSTAPLGALLGGLIGDVLGLTHVMWIASGGSLAVALWLFRSGIRDIRGATNEAIAHM